MESKRSSKDDGGGARAPVARALSGACWPDPDPRPREPILVDDVTRLNTTAMDRVFFPRSVEDIQLILGLARRHRRCVSMRGTKHSMGGHTVEPGGFLLDMARMTRVSFDAGMRRVTCGPGTKWSDLIKFLNRVGLSPRTMQSYSTFSVGGSISVNAHGITTDYCCAESVTSLDLVLWDGRAVTCSRDAKHAATGEPDEEARELFSLAIGGYGLFGVIAAITMTVNDNVHLDMDRIMTKSPADFQRIYQATIAQHSGGGAGGDGGGEEEGDIEVKLARLDIHNLDRVDIFIFRRGGAAGVRTVSPVPDAPREMSAVSKIMYKWLMPALGEVRPTIEAALGRAVDMKNDGAQRNELMYETAEPLGKLYSPLFKVDDTFVLQEYFVPAKRYVDWITRCKAIYKDVTATGGDVTLLNTTIRYVHEDTDTVLRYSGAAGGSFAFVLYYRLHRTPAGDAELRAAHERFAAVTLDLGGTFYLPYRHHYTGEDLRRAYPAADKFFARKLYYDPHGMFSNLWWRAYGTRSGVGAEPGAGAGGGPRVEALPASGLAAQAPAGEFALREAAERRDGSYRQLLRNPTLRGEFRRGFLGKIFNAYADNDALFSMIKRAAWDPRNTGDVEIYEDIQAQLKEAGGGPAAQARMVWKQMKQLRAQKEELCRETGALLHRLNRLGAVRDYVSIGDHGKMVLPFREELGVDGKVWVVNDSTSDEIPAILERGSIDPVGTFVPASLYTEDCFPATLPIPDAAADLVTMNQGLHHLPQSRLLKFLAEVRRILRPGGLFIVREHDAEPGLMPMLDLAHSVFNCVTGVPLRAERTEIRAFRPIREWRRIIESAGFTDTFLCDMEPGDPTWDEMLCFCACATQDDVVPLPKPAGEETAPGALYGMHGGHGGSSGDDVAGMPATPPALGEWRSWLDGGVASAPATGATAVAVGSDGGAQSLLGFLERVPVLLLETVKSVVDSLLASLPRARATLLTQLQSLPAGRQFLGRQALESLLSPIIDVLAKFRPYLDDVEVRQVDGGLSLVNLVPPELSLAVRALFRRADEGKASPNELMAVAVIKEVIGFFMTPEDEEDGEDDGDDEGRGRGTKGHGGGGGMGSAAGGESKADDAMARRGGGGGGATETLELHEADIRRCINDLTTSLPGLLERGFLERGGFSHRASTAIESKLFGASAAGGRLSPDQMVRFLIDYLDPESWAEMRPHVVAIAASPSKYPFTLHAMTTTTATTVAAAAAAAAGTAGAGEPWFGATMALLGSSRIRPRRTALMMAKWAGLGAVVDMFRVAQEAREQRQQRRGGAGGAGTRDDGDAPKGPQLTAAQTRELTDLVAQLGRGRAEATMEETVLRDLRDVEEVVEAVVTGGAANAGVQADVTAQVMELLDTQTGTLKLSDLSLDSLEGVPARPSSGYQFGDITRALVGRSRAVQGRILSVRYTKRERGAGAASAEETNRRVDTLLATMVRCGVEVDTAAEDTKGEWTWYKLSEWMQVEFVQVFGEVGEGCILALFSCLFKPDGLGRHVPPPPPDDEMEHKHHKITGQLPRHTCVFMEHTPWFRFPFMDFLSLYFTVLRKEFSVVQDKFGLKRAGLSYAFLTDLVPGVAMAGLFGQLNAMAFPIRKVLGDSYTQQEVDSRVEQLVVATNPSVAVDWCAAPEPDPTAGGSAVVVVATQVAPGLHVVTVPSLKPLTAALVQLARSVPSAKILRCSGHREVQVRVQIAACVRAANGVDRMLAFLATQPGCDVKFNYRHPGAEETKVSLCVQFPALLRFVRLVLDTADLTLDQVYDFWA